MSITRLGNTSVFALEVTRAANTTGYTAGDFVGPVFAFTNVSPGFIVNAKITTDAKSIVPSFRVHFMKALPTLPADNLALKLLYAEDADYVASLTLPAMSTPTDTTNSTLSRALDDTVRTKVYGGNSGGTYGTLWAVLETLTDFTPASAQKLTLTIVVDEDQ